MFNNKNIKIITVSAVLTVSFFVFLYQFSAPKFKAEMDQVTININTTEKDLIPKLKNQGYIRSEWAFNFLLKIKGWQDKIQPGGYEIAKSMNAWQLAETLVSNREQVWVVIPEGLRKEEIAEKIQKVLDWPDTEKENFISIAQEGYLFPDTYLLDVDSSGEGVAKRMYSTFNEKTADLFKEAKKTDIRNDTLIILASLIQKEAANDAEMSKIAGVIWNRWLSGMPFQIDATVQYALGKEGNWKPIVRPSDYNVDSPYNTYLHSGKPPAPICSPGLAAINAVINSDDNDYLYYLHDSNGQIHFAKTYAEHKINIDKYLK